MEVPIIQQHKCQGKKEGNYLGQHSTIIQHWILCWAACHTPASSTTKMKHELWMRQSGDSREYWLVECYTLRSDTNYQHFRETYCPLEGKSVTLTMQEVSSLKCCQIFIRRHGITSHSSQYTSGEHQRCTFRKHNLCSIQFIRIKTTKYLKWLADSHYTHLWSFSITIKTKECSEAHLNSYTAGTNGSFQDSKGKKV